MTYLIDTNVCIIYLNGKSSELRDRLNSTPVNKIRVCSIVKSELFYGSMRSNNPAVMKLVKAEHDWESIVAKLERIYIEIVIS